MTHRGPANGWPEALRTEPVPLPELPDHPTDRDLARAYGSVVITWAHYWPKLVEAFQWLYGVFIGRDALLTRIDERLAGIEARLAGSLAPMIPPMRSELASSHEAAHAVARDVAEKYEQEQKNPSTPPPDARSVEAMVADRVAVELLKLKSAELERREEQRALTDKLSADKRKALRRFWLAVATAGVSVAVTIIDRLLK